MNPQSTSLFSENISLEEVIYLVEEKGVDIESIDEYGNTPLLINCKFKKNNIIKYLISKSSNVNVYNLNRISPLLELSDDNENLNIIKVLVENGANIEHKDTFGSTVFMYSTHYESLNIAKYLLEQGANINVKDNEGWNSLITAVECNNNKHILEFLIDNGADLDAKDYQGKTFLEFFGEENKSTKEYFENYISDIKIANIKPVKK